MESVPPHILTVPVLPADILPPHLGQVPDPPFRALIADDEAVILIGISSALEKTGIQCRCAENVDEALTILRNDTIDVIVADLHMPGNDHLELLTARNNQFPEIPVIIITGYPSIQTAVHSIQQMVFDYVPKPVDMARLIHRIREAAEKGRLHRALNAWKEKYQALVDDVLATFETGILVINANLEAVCVNNTLAHYLNLERSQLEGLGGETLFQHIAQTLENPDSIVNLLKSTTQKPETESRFECHRPASANESERWFECTTKPIYQGLYAGGTILQVVDITERKNVENTLTARERELRSAMDASPHWETLASSDGLCRYISPAFENITGYSCREMQTMPDLMTRMAHAEDRERVTDHFLQINTSHDAFSFEFRIVTRLGEIRWIEHTCRPVFDEEGNIIGRRASNRDITLRKSLEDRMREVSCLSATAQLAGGLAHCFNNWMSVVQANAEMALEDLGPAHPDAPLLEDIRGAALGATKLVRRMLAFGRQSGSQASLVDLNPIIIASVNLAKPHSPLGVEFLLDLAPDLKPFRGDPERIREIINELLDNAMEACVTATAAHMDNTALPAAHTILITTRNRENVSSIPGTELKPGTYINLCIRDTGCGMTPGVLARVFEPFFSMKFYGRGMGMAAVHGIVCSHGGDIHIDSAPGEGSTINIWFPIEQNPLTASETRESELPRGEETILVVDDEDMVRNVTRMMLERLGYQVLTAQDGQEAVDLARDYQGDIDLILLDMVMPVMQGADAYPLIKARRPKAKVLVYTGFEADERAAAILRDPYCGLVKKPTTITTLAIAIRNLLDRTTEENSPPQQA